jgi:hypothetical protein
LDGEEGKQHGQIGERATDPLRALGTRAFHMDYVDLGIIFLAALMVWLLYKVTKETRAYAATQRRYVLRQARTEAHRGELVGAKRAQQ